MDVTSNHSIRQSVAEHTCLTQTYVSVTAEGLPFNLRIGALTPGDTSYFVASNASMTNWFSRWYIEGNDLIYFNILKQNGRNIYNLF